ncbi:MAG: hypothetical protein RLY16_1200 [Bacteroidota bacterium]|jgi:Tfp pilus assembly protein PilF
MERIEKLKAFLEQTPNDCFLQHALALEYIKLGDDVQARLLFESLLNHDASYVGSYFHLGKLQARNNEIGLAIATYEKGMEEAKKQGDRHAYSELQGALEELTDD